MKDGLPRVMPVVLPVFIPLLVLSLAMPAREQSHVYTNADLNKPLSTRRPVPTAETIEGLAAHQFVLPDHYDGPYVVGVFSSPTAGPFGEFWPQIRESWDGSSFSYSPFSNAPFGYPAVGRRTYFGRGLTPFTGSPVHARRGVDAHHGAAHQQRRRTAR
jgi:hypothetical protein